MEVSLRISRSDCHPPPRPQLPWHAQGSPALVDGGAAASPELGGGGTGGKGPIGGHSGNMPGGKGGRRPWGTAEKQTVVRRGLRGQFHPRQCAWLLGLSFTLAGPAYHSSFAYFSSSHPFLPRMSFWRADIWDCPALLVPSPGQVPEDKEGPLWANEGPLTVRGLWQQWWGMRGRGRSLVSRLRRWW